MFVPIIVKLLIPICICLDPVYDPFKIMMSPEVAPLITVWISSNVLPVTGISSPKIALSLFAPNTFSEFWALPNLLSDKSLSLSSSAKPELSPAELTSLVKISSVFITVILSVFWLNPCVLSSIALALPMKIINITNTDKIINISFLHLILTTKINDLYKS